MKKNIKKECAFKQTVDLLKLADKYLESGNMDMYYSFISNVRNPIIHERKGKEYNFILNYEIDSRNVPSGNTEQKTVKSHLVGMRNAALIISKFGIHNQWETADDYVKTIQALQPLLTCPKTLDKLVKDENKWNFDFDNIEESIFWNIKLKKSGVKYLINNKGKKVPVNKIWKTWYDEFYSPYVDSYLPKK